MNALATIDMEATLPALVRRAASKLAAAETSAEVLEAREEATLVYDAAKRAGRIAKAKRAHDEVIAAVYHAQADALEIESMAKRRLADEYDAAQERGEVASVGKPVIVPDGNNKPTAEDIGLTRKEIFEARQIRDAEVMEPGIVRRTLDTLIEKGEEPTRAAVRREIETSATADQPTEEAMEVTEATVEKTDSRVGMFIPDGADIVELCRRGIKLEESGMRLDRAAEEVGLAANAYKLARQVVLLADNSVISTADAKLAAEALEVLVATRQPGRAWEIVEPIGKRLWGSGSRWEGLTSIAGKRLDKFEATIGVITQVCLSAEEVELPYLSAEQVKKFTYEIGRARGALARFTSTMKGIHK